MRDVEEMTRVIGLVVVGLALMIVSVHPVWADYDTGKRAWDAGKPAEAVAQWQVAADAGDRRAMLALGRLYLQGLGALQDYVLAHMWFNLAASRGEMEALKERDAVMGKMTPQQVAEAQKRAREWRPGSGEAGEPKPASASKPAAVPSRPAPGPPPARAIREAQELLTALGYKPGAADGKWGGRSADAYASFLREAGLPPGDVLTPEGLHAMRSTAKRRGKGAEAGVAENTKPQSRPSAATRPPRDEEVVKRKEFRDCAECPEMVVIPAGSFIMGSPDGEEGRSYFEGPRHEVKIAKPFAVGKYEVTFAEWDACVAGGGCNGYRPRDFGWGRGRRPVIDVRWKDAKSYVEWLSQKTGQTYRLLSEAEWEYAARGGTTGPFHFGSTISTDLANYDGDYTYGTGGKGVDRGKTVRAGTFPANGFGLHDVHGNVWEWVEDCWHKDYSGAPADGSAWIDGDCWDRVLRGGSWYGKPRVLRSANRSWNSAGIRDDLNGFRIARTLTP